MAEYLRFSEVADRLSISIDQVKALVCAGEIPAVCISVKPAKKHRQYRVAIADLEAFEAARRTKPASKAPRSRKESYKAYVGTGSKE